MSNMNAEPKNIGRVFGDNTKFKIPVFQRDYSWKRENWKELWEDIVNGYNEKNKHYLGSIVLVDNNNIKEVLDGQQRLTTLSIIMKAIHWNVKELIRNNIDVISNEKRLSLIGRLIFEEDIYNIDEVSNRIRLNDINDAIYSTCIVKDNDIDMSTIGSKSNQLLVDCYKYYKSEIRKTCTREGESIPNITNLINYFKYICEEIIVVEITVLDYSNAYVIFETLNDRGLELTVTDLLKNFLFSHESSTEHIYINSVWNRIIGSIGEKNFTKYLRHYWNSKNKKVTENKMEPIRWTLIKESLSI